MNLSLAFLHGEQAFLAFIFVAFTVLFGVPLLGYVWLRHTKLSERKLALAYFIVTGSACGVFALGGLDSAYIPLLTVFYIAFIFTLPWNVISIFALYWFGNQYMSNHEIAFVMLLGAGINTMLLYFLAKTIRGSV
jgi:hypothetical protein